MYGSLKRGLAPTTSSSQKQAPLSGHVGTNRLRMDETETYQKRLQAIAEKRRLQEEQERAKRELENEKLRLQHLKRKSLRDQWLMDGPVSPTSPTFSEPRSPLWGSQARDIEQRIDQLQTESLQLAEKEEKLEQQMEGGQDAVMLAEANAENIQAVILENGQREKELKTKAAKAPLLEESELHVNMREEAEGKETSHEATEKVGLPNATNGPISVDPSDRAITMTFLGFTDGGTFKNPVTVDDEEGQLVMMRAERVIITDEGEELNSEEVASDEVANEVVASDEVANEVVASDEVANEVVVSDEVANEVVASDEVANEVVASDEVANEVVASVELANEVHSTTTVQRSESPKEEGCDRTKPIAAQEVSSKETEAEGKVSASTEADMVTRDLDSGRDAEDITEVEEAEEEAGNGEEEEGEEEDDETSSGVVAEAQPAEGAPVSELPSPAAALEDAVLVVPTYSAASLPRPDAEGKASDQLAMGELLKLEVKGEKEVSAAPEKATHPVEQFQEVPLSEPQMEAELAEHEALISPSKTQTLREQGPAATETLIPTREGAEGVIGVTPKRKTCQCCSVM
ncbi:hypothetical protein UPYG_G00064120 [Umbra pygmaea]|uniref:Paralemmin-3 n=1 Tax=Umbra pygmaea TaxID=75934 RepID=A0ABD0XA09_UMBPY